MSRTRLKKSAFFVARKDVLAPAFVREDYEALAGGKRILFDPSFVLRNVQHPTEFRKLAVDGGDRAGDFQFGLCVAFKRAFVASQIAASRPLVVLLCNCAP
jgi:hypothetical protein